MFTALSLTNQATRRSWYRRWIIRRHKKSKAQDSAFFWSPLRFLEHELPAIRKKSQNTVASYRTSLNICIDYLEDMKGLRRERICFRDLNKENLKDYLVWMGQIREWSPKTCNLRPTVISPLLSYASEECMDITPGFVSSKTISTCKIEYFEDQ